MDLSGGIIMMASVINPGALDHQKEALVAVASSLAQSLHSSLSHLMQRRVLVVLGTAVDLVRDVCISEETQHRKVKLGTTLQTIEACAVRDVVEAVLACQVHDIAVVGSAGMLDSGVWDKVTASTTKHQIDHTAKRVIAHHLLGDAIFFLAHVDVRGKAGRCGIGDARGNDQACHISGLLCCLEHRPAGLVVGRDRDSTIITLLRAREGGSAGSRIGDQTGRGSSTRLADHVLVDDELLAEGCTVLELHKAARQAQTGGTHAVRHHEDEVALPVVIAGRAVCRTSASLLEYHSENDDSCSR